VNPHASLPPSAWIERFASHIPCGTTLLDVACGYGRHAKLFAARGARVSAVDRDAAAIDSLRGVTRIVAEQRDLEGTDASPNAWPYASASFDAIVVCNYLWRPTFDRLLDSVKPGGILLYETFMVGHERFGKPSRSDFLLRSNELLEKTMHGFVVCAFEQGERLNASGQPSAVMQSICARKK
jgi:SAM-dependent methyltransferase